MKHLLALCLFVAVWPLGSYASDFSISIGGEKNKKPQDWYNNEIQLALDGDAYSMYTVGWLNCEDKIEDASMTRCLTWYLIAAFHRNEEAKKVLPPCVRIVVRRSTFPLFLRWAG